MNKILSVCFILSLVVVVWGVEMPEPKDFTILRAERQILLNGAYPTETIRIEYKCLVVTCPNTFTHIVRASDDTHLVKIAFGTSKSSSNIYTYSKIHHQHGSELFIGYVVDTESQMSKDQAAEIYITMVYINRYVNFPTSITLSEDQKFQYIDHKHFLSIYDVDQSSTTYKFNKIISYDSDGEKKGLSSVVFKNSSYPSFHYHLHTVHGVNNQPQVVFTEVEKIIQVSHWGNIAITEFYHIKNIGPALKGEFSRIQFSSQNSFEAKNSFKGIQTQLPYKAWGLYYRDEVGNISTSRAYRDDRKQVVRFGLTPRFSLLGGWKSNWEIGYNLDTKGYLKTEGNHFKLDRISLQYALHQVLSENYKVKIILPEDAANVQIKIGDHSVVMNTVEEEKNFGYLDFTGRPSFTIENISGHLQNKNIEVNYDLDTLAVLKKPIYIFSAIFAALLFLVVIKRLNFSAFDQPQHSKCN